MPRIEHLYDRPKKRRFSFLALAVLVAMSSVSSYFVFQPKSVTALNGLGPDPNDFGGQPVAFVVDNTGYVDIKETSFRVYFPKPTGNNLTITSAGLMDAKQYNGTVDTFDQIYIGTIPGATTWVTRYDTSGTSSPASCLAISSRLTCSFNFDFTGIKPDISTGLYVMTLTAVMNTALPSPNVHNGFSAIANNGGTVGFDSSISNTKFGIQQKINPRIYRDWKLKFGADCTTLPVGKTVPFKWYDADNGNTGVQPPKPPTGALMSFQIFDDTGSGNALVALDGSTFVNPDGSTFNSTTNTVTPGIASKKNGSIGFFARPGHTYYVKFSNVYSNNTLQFQLPFDSIFHETPGCLKYQLIPNITQADSYFQPGGTYDVVLGATNVGEPTRPFSMTLSKLPGSPDGSGYVTPITSMTFGGLTLGKNQTGFAPPKIVKVTVSNAAADGTQVCFTNTITPANLSLDTAVSGLFCRYIRRVYTPKIIGNNSDIHAGGGLCNGALSNGSVIGTGSSYGQYVVSASFGIGGFGSNDSPTSSSANIGGGGGYNQVCRKDLATVADGYVANGGAVNAIVPGQSAIGINAFNNPGLPNVIYVLPRSTPLYIHGFASRKMTIYNPNPGVPIIINSSSITLSEGGGTTYNNLPSVGVISRGPIRIVPGVINVNAYLFSNSEIDTCYIIFPQTLQNSCKNTLTVQGFLMSQNLLLHRLGAFSATDSLPLGERIVMSPQLYLSPPPFFDNAREQNVTQSQGERPPLY